MPRALRSQSVGTGYATYGTPANGWVKASIAADVKKKELFAIEVSEESMADNAHFISLVDSCEDVCKAGKARMGQIVTPSFYKITLTAI